MTAVSPNRKKRLLVHSFGLSCLGGAIFLQILVFVDIVRRGYFIAVERNPVILTVEVGLTICALVYFVYLYQRFMIAAD